jgi:nitrile hydratase subunit beta
MNGVHDMGGMHGFGPVEPEANEPVFHRRWEARTHAIAKALGSWGKWNIDYGRHQRELIPPAEYLCMSYYEKWFTALAAQIVKVGLVTREEVESGQPAPGTSKVTPPLTVEGVHEAIFGPSPFTRDVQVAARFKPGDRVRTRNLHPAGHTRLPRYARNHVGVVRHDHGVHVFPDTNAHFQGEHPQHLYSVRFEAQELWGEEVSPRDAVYLDLWESYLDRP